MSDQANVTEGVISMTVVLIKDDDSKAKSILLATEHQCISLVLDDYKCCDCN